MLWLAKLSETRMASRSGVNDETGSSKPAMRLRECTDKPTRMTNRSVPRFERLLARECAAKNSVASSTKLHVMSADIP